MISRYLKYHPGGFQTKEIYPSTSLFLHYNSTSLSTYQQFNRLSASMIFVGLDPDVGSNTVPAAPAYTTIETLSFNL